MKRFSTIISIFLISGLVYWAYYALMPQSFSSYDTPMDNFSTERAMAHVKNMAQKEHYVGSEAHAEVRNYIVKQLRNLGVSTTIQSGYTSGNWGNLSKAINIIGKIEGSEGRGKSLMLLSHYDSSPHSSFGASDAASGVATILEAVRAYTTSGKKPKNDIIILISDAEELGLNGARLFVSEHPWAQNIGLILNFEARGSGGPSYMLIETNGGNKKLIKSFNEAHPKYPVANSLAYSIYKMLPNDTDLTVFREDADIEGFNFAFIDDHFDYHTALDTHKNLDKNTLEHQGSYLVPMLSFFSDTDLTDLKSDQDYIYFNIPLFRLVFYPFSWIFPMLITAFLIFIALLRYGFKKNRLALTDVLKGFLPFLLSLLLCFLLGYGWGVLKSMYPQYKNILHGFTYNGHWYIATFAALSLAICFWAYSRFKKITPSNLLIAPLFFWFVICAALAIYLKGASFFIIPVFAALISLFILIRQENPNMLLLVFLLIPSLWILTPFLQMFPVGLGLKMLAATSILTALIFSLSISVFGFYKKKSRMGWLAFLFAIAFFTKAHFESKISPQTPNPSSLLYVLDDNESKANWATYDASPDNWVKQYVGENPGKSSENKNVLSSKYNTSFSFTAEAPFKDIEGPKTEVNIDTIINGERLLEICITPQRLVNRLEVFTDPDLEIKNCSVNGVSFTKEYLESSRRRGRLVTHYVSNKDYTEIVLTVPADSSPEFTLFESSYDLLENELFTIPKRPDNAIPMPFVLNDAIVIKKTFKID